MLPLRLVAVRDGRTVILAAIRVLRRAALAQDDSLSLKLSRVSPQLRYCRILGLNAEYSRSVMKFTST